MNAADPRKGLNVVAEKLPVEYIKLDLEDPFPRQVIFKRDVLAVDLSSGFVAEFIHFISERCEKDCGRCKSLLSVQQQMKSAIIHKDCCAQKVLLTR